MQCYITSLSGYVFPYAMGVPAQRRLAILRFLRPVWLPRISFVAEERDLPCFCFVGGMQITAPVNARRDAAMLMLFLQLCGAPGGVLQASLYESCGYDKKQIMHVSNTGKLQLIKLTGIGWKGLYDSILWKVLACHVALLFPATEDGLSLRVP